MFLVTSVLNLKLPCSEGSSDRVTLFVSAVLCMIGVSPATSLLILASNATPVLSIIPRIPSISVARLSILLPSCASAAAKVLSAESTRLPRAAISASIDSLIMLILEVVEFTKSRKYR